MRKLITTTFGLVLSTLVLGQTSAISQLNAMADKVPGSILTIKKNEETRFLYKGLANLEKKLLISTETRFRMASISKQFTAMAVYLLIQEGKISFETPLISIFPELPKACQPIQIKHLLNHSSGLADYEYLIPQSQKEQLSDADVLKLIQHTDSVYFEAGSQFRYSNTAFCLLSLIVERVSKQSYEQFCQERIFQKLSMKNAQISAPKDFENRAFGYHPINDTFKFADQSVTSATRGDGGVYISANDFVKWMDKDNPLFNSKFLEDFEKHKIAVKDQVYYSLGFFSTKDHLGNLTLFHSGESTGFHNIMLFKPQQNMALSLFTNRDDLYIVDLFDGAMQNENIEIPSIKESLFLWLNKVYSGE